jgi:hypothetical protein
MAAGKQVYRTLDHLLAAVPAPAHHPQLPGGHRVLGLIGFVFPGVMVIGALLPGRHYR